MPVKYMKYLHFHLLENFNWFANASVMLSLTGAFNALGPRLVRDALPRLFYEKARHIFAHTMRQIGAELRGLRR